MELSLGNHTVHIILQYENPPSDTCGVFEGSDYSNVIVLFPTNCQDTDELVATLMHELTHWCLWIASKEGSAVDSISQNLEERICEAMEFMAPLVHQRLLELIPCHQALKLS